MKNKALQKGLILINVLVFTVIAITVTIALINWALVMIKSSAQLAAKEQAFQIAESGIDYYRWHLAHAVHDYTDGNAPNAPGPFVHDFKDKNGNVIGQYSLTITPPPLGSSVVIVKSKGTVTAVPGLSRTIKVTLAIPSLARYSVVANDVMRFGAGTEVFGAVHSNNGIRFDGVAHNLITSATDAYVDVDNGSAQRFGVYTTSGTTDPSPPNAVPNRPDVFVAGRQFPVPTIDFVGMTAGLSATKNAAQTGGRYFAGSGAEGYHVVLKTNDTFDLYKITTLKTPSGSCRNDGDYQTGWGTWSIKNQTFLQNYTFPTNGSIFFEDNVWVDGKIKTARITIAAGKFPDNPSTWKNIMINSDLLYTNYDGQDAVSLMAQGNITSGLSSSNDLRVDAALVAQNGRAGRYYYSDNCGSDYSRHSITLYGMIATNTRYGFAYSDGTGYGTRNLLYDSNLLYSPPPNFPLTSDQYSTISWDEVK